jgi:hypothetical protein
MLVRHGYGVLLFDRRGGGDSDGDPNALGWDGDRDIKAGLAFLRDRGERLDVRAPVVTTTDQVQGLSTIGRHGICASLSWIALVRS